VKIFKSKYVNSFALADDLLNPEAATTPTPAQAQFETQIDNISNTKIERVKQPDGSYATVRSKLPLSAEDQLYEDTLNGIAQSSLDYITKLSTDYNVDDIPWLKEYLADYKADQSGFIDRAASVRTTSEEKALARFGQGDSTAGIQARAQRGSDITDQRVQLGRNMSGIEQDARNSELSKQGSLYSLATGALNTQKSTQLGSLAALSSTGLTQQNAAQSYNNMAAGVVGQNNASQLAARQAGLSNLASIASLAAAPFTGGASLAAGGLFGAVQKSGWAQYGAAA